MQKGKAMIHHHLSTSISKWGQLSKSGYQGNISKIGTAIKPRRPVGRLK